MVMMPGFSFVLLSLIEVTILTYQTQANVISRCKDHAECCKTYDDAYTSLASPQNYHNIALALYPSRYPSSVLLQVNLYSMNQSDYHTERTSPEQYTWSTSCLYAAIPARVLEFLSLGAILITPRTRDLDISIPPFCRNVSEEERIVIIERVLSEVSQNMLENLSLG